MRYYMNKVLVFMLFLLFTITATAMEDPIGPTSKKDAQGEYLFVQTAGQGTLEKDPVAGIYWLRLKNVDPWVIYFSNVPKRVTGFMPISDFNHLMNHEVKIAYPKGLNSGLIALSEKLDGKEKSIRYIFTLSQPEYDSASATLRYMAILVPGEQLQLLPRTEKFSHVALFIDSVCISCVAQGF